MNIDTTVFIAAASKCLDGSSPSASESSFLMCLLRVSLKSLLLSGSVCLLRKGVTQLTHFSFPDLQINPQLLYYLFRPEHSYMKRRRQLFTNTQSCFVLRRSILQVSQVCGRTAFTFVYNTLIFVFSRHSCSSIQGKAGYRQHLRPVGQLLKSFLAQTSMQ